MKKLFLLASFALLVPTVALAGPCDEISQDVMYCQGFGAYYEFAHGRSLDDYNVEYACKEVAFAYLICLGF